MTFAQEIEAAAAGEPIEAIVVSAARGWAWSEAGTDERPLQAWADVRASLDYEYDGGFGGLDSHAIVAWTPSRVLFVREYDGASNVEWLPRAPRTLYPETVGG